MLSTGTIVDGKFEIISALAMGGFGIIYQARQLGFDRIVALKVLHANAKIEPEDMKRFEREARILSSLRHRNLVMFYGFGSYEGALYMAMELLKGESLDALLGRKNKLSPGETIAIAKQICEALSCSHSHGVVHRDLKPSNIMLVDTKEGLLVKVIDFGLAKLITADITEMQKLTEAGSTVGSVEYMSPEQCTGSAADERTDIYSIGCIMQHCLAGRPPFIGDHTVVVMRQQVQQAPPLLSEFVELPTEYQFIINKTLAKEAGGRYRKAEELLSDLQAVEEGGGKPLIAFGAPQPGPLKKVKRASPRAAMLPFTITAIVLAIALGAGFAQYFSVAFRPPIETTSLVHWNEAKAIEEGRRPSRNASEAQLNAITRYTLALDRNKADGLLDNNQIAAINARLGDLQTNEGNYKVGRHYASQAIAMMILDDKFNTELLRAVGSYAVCCHALDKDAEGLETLERVDKLWPARNGQFGNSSVRRLIAQAYLNSQQPQRALDVLHELQKKAVGADLNSVNASIATAEGMIKHSR